MHAFETEGGKGNLIDVSISTNRYSDSASHIGIAKEAAAILDISMREPKVSRGQVRRKTSTDKRLKVEIKDKKLCSRYTAEYFENVSIGSSSKWIREILEDCGLRSVNNVVDIMNYAMLEVGQPLHAFDYDKIEGGKLIIRKAKEGERITSIDGMTHTLKPGMLVIADTRGPIAIAGIRGGKRAEVTKKTKRIVVESANFDPVSIYKTSKELNLSTDASIRFSHNLNKELAIIGLDKVRELLLKELKVKAGVRFDSSPKGPPRRAITLGVDWFNGFIGADLTKKEIEDKLARLGFENKGGKVLVPVLRQDIETKEDLAEEVIRLVGFNKLKSRPPIVSIKPSEFDEQFRLRDMVRNILTGFGFDEVYNYSFVSKGSFGAIEIDNPISEDKKYLRESLLPLLSKNIEDNFRFFDEVRVFELGKVFSKRDKAGERCVLGIAVGVKKGDRFFELKGVVDELLKRLGLTEFFTAVTDSPHMLRLESDHTVLGYLHHEGKSALAEIDTAKLRELIKGEISFAPLPKYPSAMRDISIVVDNKVKIGDVIQEIQLSNVNLIKDVDLMDEYLGEGGERQSITLRIVFRAEKRTLKAKEVDKEMKKVTRVLQDKFGARVR